MSLWALGSSSAQRVPPLAAAALGAAPATDSPKEAAGALAALAKYIPAESTAVFLAALGLVGAIENPAIEWLRWEWVVYVACASLTPTIVYLAARIVWRNSSPPPTTSFSPPVWRMIASTVAFLVWALAVPGVLPDKNLAVLASICAMLLSPAFVLLEGAFVLDR
jgi:hypothetical protein